MFEAFTMTVVILALVKSRSRPNEVHNLNVYKHITVGSWVVSWSQDADTSEGGTSLLS